MSFPRPDRKEMLSLILGCFNIFYRYFVDWGNAGIGSPLKADDNWARQAREKNICFLSERGYSLVDKVLLQRCSQRLSLLLRDQQDEDV
jgi:hypothetical protein